MMRPAAILLDIEGTTTPVDFVTQTLFAYARSHLKEFLQGHASQPDVRADLETLQREQAADAARETNPPAWPAKSVAPCAPSDGGALLPETIVNRQRPIPDLGSQSSTINSSSANREARVPNPAFSPSAEPHNLQSSIPDAVAVYVLWLMDQDRKSTGLKSLQGKIWEEGYRRGELKGRVYPDVPDAFARWRAAQIVIAIFSSGSVLAQRLLFAHSDRGDLTPFIQAYFDTTTGPKRAAASYRRITASLGVEPGRSLFVSDVSAELDAARAAGMFTLLSVRPGSTRPEWSAHPIVKTFDEIDPIFS